MTWGFIWLMVILKIPIFGLLYLVWWAIHQETDDVSSGDDDGGSKLALRPARHPRPRLPRHPRRGPHGTPVATAPTRTRPVRAKARTLHR